MHISINKPLSNPLITPIRILIFCKRVHVKTQYTFVTHIKYTTLYHSVIYNKYICYNHNKEIFYKCMIKLVNKYRI